MLFLAVVIYLATFRCQVLKVIVYNKQLLDEAEHDIKNYSDRGQCYLPKRS